MKYIEYSSLELQLSRAYSKVSCPLKTGDDFATPEVIMLGVQVLNSLVLN